MKSLRKHLFIKFLLVYLFFFLLAFSFVSFYGGTTLQRYFYNTEGNALYKEVTRIANYYSQEEKGKLSISGLSSEMEGNIHNKAWGWTLISPEGEILLHYGPEKIKGEKIADFHVAEKGDKTYYSGDLQGMLTEEQLISKAPIRRNFQNLAYLYLHIPLSEIEAKKEGAMEILFEIFALTFILSFSVFAVFYFFVYRPLRKITAGAVRYAAGEYLYRIQVSSEDEMGYLADTLNYMAEEIQKSDDYQRQFIANVSHDFRSPLTSIKGYLEAMLDGTIPRDKEEKYLERLIMETDRLSKITQSMLSLNKLDEGGNLNRSNFDINRMIREVCSSFEMQCAKKKLQFSLVFAEKKEMVYGDYPKIQQVLYNLLDNAVKFSKEGTEVIVRTERRGTKVFISVKDQGIGIPKKDLQKIWERFYKTDLSRGRDKRGTGLGLSIVKSIITAHNEHIDCISTEGVGTEFSFALPMSLKEEA